MHVVWPWCTTRHHTACQAVAVLRNPWTCDLPALAWRLPVLHLYICAPVLSTYAHWIQCCSRARDNCCGHRALAAGAGSFALAGLVVCCTRSICFGQQMMFDLSCRCSMFRGLLRLMSTVASHQTMLLTWHSCLVCMRHVYLCAAVIIFCVHCCG